MGRGHSLTHTRLGPRGGAIKAGVCMAMAMAASTKVVSAFSTKTSTSTSTIPHNSLCATWNTQASIDINSNNAQTIHRSSTRFFATAKIQEDDCGCDDAALQRDESGNDLFGENIGSLLKHTTLTTVGGNSVKLGKYIGDAENDATIVVFLRHLA